MMMTWKKCKFINPLMECKKIIRAFSSCLKVKYSEKSPLYTNTIQEEILMQNIGKYTFFITEIKRKRRISIN